MKFLAALCLLTATLHAAPPNIVLILADDLGYGDLSCYGATAVKTPNCDRLAAEGVRHTAGYASSSTCTPSRFSMLTGQYAFRQKGTGVLPGDASLIIAPGRVTLPSILRKAGYMTGVVGKWHLGLGDANRPVDWNNDIRPSPLDIGFDYSFIMAATGDRVPCVYVENRKVVGLDPADPIEVHYGGQPFPGELNGVLNRDQLRMDWSHGHNNSVVNGIGRIGFMRGGRTALWEDKEMAANFARRAVAFMVASKDTPFFLYFATHSIHVPRVPDPRFVGKTTMGPRGDAIVEFDWQVGEVLAELDRLKIADNTLVIVTSDNGPVVDDGYKDGAVEKLGTHKPAGPLRGGKYSRFEGGTRVPLLVRWPARVKPGVSDALVSQVDFPASFAALVGQNLNDPKMGDSQNVLGALLGETKTGRDHIIEHSGNLAIRVGQWKYIAPNTGVKVLAETKTETANDPEPQLYDLAADPGEQTNVAAQHPDKVEELSKRLEEVRNQKVAREPAPLEKFVRWSP